MIRFVGGAFNFLKFRLLHALGWLVLLRPEVWVVTGREQTTQLPLTVLCAVSNRSKSRNYLLHVIFGDAYHGRRLGRFWIWNLNKALTKAGDCPLVVAQLRQSHFALASWREWFYIPEWVWGEVALPRDADATRKVNGDLRRIRRHGLEGEVTQDPQQYDDFYYNMYVPYITQTFGDCAGIAPHRKMKQAFRRGGLLLIKQNGKSIAGQLIVHYGHGACLENMGVRDGNRSYVQEGAGCALYHYGLQHMEQNGIKTAWVGWSRSFLRDGVLRFKKKWSQRIVGSSASGFALRASPHSPAARAFLLHNPFVVERHGKFFAACFTSDEAPPEPEELKLIDREYFHPGMERLYLYCLASQRAPTQWELPAEYDAHMELRGALDIPGADECSVAMPSETSAAVTDTVDSLAE